MSKQSRECNKCGTELIPNENWTAGCAKNRDYTCTSCRSMYQKRWYVANKDACNIKHKARYERHKETILGKQKYYNIKKKYGLSREQYNKLMKNAVCEICGSNNELCVDHNHSTGKVRGVLCRVCNQALGLFYDDPKIIRKAGEYLNDRND